MVLLLIALIVLIARLILALIRTLSGLVPSSPVSPADAPAQGKYESA